MKNQTLELLTMLRKIDRRGCTIRDVLVLYIIMHNPGLSGKEVADNLNITNRSNVAKNLQRLLEKGLIEDRRTIAAKARPNRLYVLPAGLQFWQTIKYWESPEGSTNEIPIFETPA